MNLSEAIKQRRSIREFTNQPVPDSMIHNMIEAAISAPSASNRQPWRFMVLRDSVVRSRLSACVQEAVDGAMKDIQPEFENQYRSYAQHFLCFDKAPVLIVALHKAEATMANLFKEDSTAHDQMTELELNGSVIGVAMAVQNLLLAATEQGLGTCVTTGPLIAKDAFNRVLSVPAGWNILCMVCVGYAVETPPVIRKKTVSQVIIPAKTGESYGME